jgi:hypothetical protein
MITPWQDRYNSGELSFEASMQAEIIELRAALQERDAEIASIMQAITDPENQPSQYGTVLMADMQKVHAELHRTYECIRSHARITFAAEEKVQAQRKVLEQALEALNVMQEDVVSTPNAYEAQRQAVRAILEVLHE